jgi:type II secretory pathway pseudopilin PulG
VSTDSYPAGPVPRRGLAIASLVLGILSIPSFGCLIVGAVAGVVLGIVALMRANREPHLHGGKGMAIAGIATSALSLLLVIPIGIIAAIAIPSLLRARTSANEAATIGDIRTVISAEAAYQSASGGYYGPPECLSAPATCLPAYSGPTFLSDDLASASVKSGYRRTFHPGPAVSTGAPLGIPAATGRLESFAYTAVPAERGRTGTRGFCGDSTGRICFTADGSEPAVAGGACDPGCQDLR